VLPISQEEHQNLLKLRGGKQLRVLSAPQSIRDRASLGLFQTPATNPATSGDVTVIAQLVVSAESRGLFFSRRLACLPVGLEPSLPAVKACREIPNYRHVRAFF
jgi:hypothetical protein